MSTNQPIFSTGDWIVHRQYGIGQIKKKEEKAISGHREEYYKVQTPDSTIWLPVNKLDKSWFRPLATPTEFKEAFGILRRPPHPMHKNFMQRKNRINKVQSENAIPAIAGLIRDLNARRQEKPLSDTEQRALKHLTERFVAEWCVCMDLDVSEAQQQLKNLLNHQNSTLIQ